MYEATAKMNALKRPSAAADEDDIVTLKRPSAAADEDRSKKAAKAPPTTTTSSPSSPEREAIEAILKQYPVDIAADSAAKAKQRKKAHSAAYHAGTKLAKQHGLDGAEAKSKGVAFAKLLTNRFDDVHS